jgi:ribosome biogenesis GTPase
LGFDDWWEDVPRNSVSRVRPRAGHRRGPGRLPVRDPGGEVHAALAGRFRFAVRSVVDLPCVGDWVCIRHPAPGGPAVIRDVLPAADVPAAQMPRESHGISDDCGQHRSVAFIVQGCPYDFNVPRLDRYLVVAIDGRIEHRIVLSKTDLISPEDLERFQAEIRAAGITAHGHSAQQ